MLAYSYRFHGHKSLSYVYKNGLAERGQYITIRYTKNERRSKPRISVVVSKKVYKSAVGRNRIRRRIYEWFRTHLNDLNDTYDIVCIVSSAEVRTMSVENLDTILHAQTTPLLAVPGEK